MFAVKCRANSLACDYVFRVAVVDKVLYHDLVHGTLNTDTLQFFCRFVLHKVNASTR